MSERNMLGWVKRGWVIGIDVHARVIGFRNIWIFALLALMVVKFSKFLDFDLDWSKGGMA